MLGRRGGVRIRFKVLIDAEDEERESRVEGEWQGEEKGDGEGDELHHSEAEEELCFDPIRKGRMGEEVAPGMRLA